MNREWGRVNEGAMEYAPDTLHDGDTYIVAPSPADYRQHDYLPNVDEPPTTPPREGYHYEPRGWAVENGRNVHQYAEVADPPPPPRTFRRSWLAQWIRAAGLWSAFGVFLDQNADFAFLWLYSTEFDEDSPQWPAALAAFKTALGLTDEQAAQMLAFAATGEAPT